MKLTGPLLASAALHGAAVAGVVGTLSLLSSAGTGGVVTVSLVERGMDARGPAGENPEEAGFVPPLAAGEREGVRGGSLSERKSEKREWLMEAETLSGAVRPAGTARDTTTRSASVTPAPAAAEGGKGEIGESGTGGSDPLAVVLERVSAVKKYPPLARLRGITGTAWVLFRVGEGGTPERIEIASSSGSDLLDRAAVRAVQDASPFPAGPAAFRVGLRFELSE